MNRKIARNPDKLNPGEPCFGVCLPSFRSRADEACLPGAREIIPGKVMGDYACKPLDGDGPAAYFMPDAPLENTRIDSPFYLLDNWAVFRSRAEAMAARAMLAKDAIAAHRSAIEGLEKYV